MDTHFLRAGARPAVRLLLFAVLLLYLLYHTTKFRLSEIWPLRPTGDAAIMFDVSQRIVAQADYPARLGLGNFFELLPYPPPAVLMLANLSAAGRQYFTVIWLILMALGLFWSMRATLAGEAPATRAAWLLLGVCGVAVAGSPIAWDLRYANSNLICLGFVMLGYANLARRPVLAGCCVAVSIAFKLYSGLLLGWLLISRPKAAVACLVTTIVLWLLWPLAVFGPTGAAAIYAGWREQVRIIAAPWVYPVLATGVGPGIVTLRRAAMAITGEAPDAAATKWIVGSLLVGWTLLVLWYVQRALKAGLSRAPSRAAIADWVVLLLAPLPFSPWLEPHHTVALLPAALLLITVALDQKVIVRHRIMAGTALAGVTLLREFVGPFPLRGLSLLGQFALIVFVLAMLRREFGRQAFEGQRQDERWIVDDAKGAGAKR